MNKTPSNVKKTASWDWKGIAPKWQQYSQELRTVKKGGSVTKIPIMLMVTRQDSNWVTKIGWAGDLSRSAYYHFTASYLVTVHEVEGVGFISKPESDAILWRPLNSELPSRWWSHEQLKRSQGKCNLLSLSSSSNVMMSLSENTTCNTLKQPSSPWFFCFYL